MKAFRTLLGILSLGILFIYSGCGGGGGNSESIQDKQLGLLSKTWKVVTPTGGVLLGPTGSQADSTTHWTSFTLTLSGTSGASSFSYACANRPKLSVWPLQGTWSFDTTTPTSAIVRDPSTNDQLSVGYTVDAAGKNLQLTFTYNGSGYSRADNVSGQWTFNMVSTN